MVAVAFGAIERARRNAARWAAWWITVGRGAQRLLAPLVDLMVRLALVRAFFAADMFPGGWTGSSVTHWPVVAAQIAGPALLVGGLLVRPVSLAVLLLILLTPGAGPGSDEHLFWAVLFGWYVVRGAGPLSLDHLLQRGLGFSPLPFAGRAMRAARWADRRIGPVYVLAVRLWLAAAVAGAALPEGMLPSMASAALPRSSMWLTAVLLALGLATPLVAVGLLVTASGMAMAGGSGGPDPYGLLLLALVGALGAGPHSLDHWLARAVWQPSAVADDAPRVVIVGAGFGGMACALALRHERARVTLIDRHNYHLFQPLLYQVATGSLSPGDIAAPIRAAFRADARLRVLCGAVTGVDTSAREVVTDGRRVPYDVLVLATGASHAYFGHEDWSRAAPGLKSIEDATRIRSRILAAFERAEATEDAAERQALLTFLVCGAGPTGVEMAGAIAELARHGMTGSFRSFDPASARVILVQSGPRILPQFDERLSRFAHASLQALGVEVRVDSRVEAIDEGGVRVSGQRIVAATVLWAAGVVASPAACWLGVEPDKAGRIRVAPDLSVIGASDVFAIGDTAMSLAWNGEPAPGLAPAAKQGGAYVAAVIRARLRGGRPPPPFRYRHQGSLATIGRRSAVADFGRVKLTGALAWWLWGAVHILFLVGLRNRFAVMLGWMWSYVTFRVGVQLITGEEARAAPAPQPRR